MRRQNVSRNWPRFKYCEYTILASNNTTTTSSVYYLFSTHSLWMRRDKAVCSFIFHLSKELACRVTFMLENARLPRHQVVLILVYRHNCSPKHFLSSFTTSITFHYQRHTEDASLTWTGITNDDYEPMSMV